MTIDFLIEIVGCFLQKLALTTLPMGGIYISGGVSNYISTYFETKQEIFWTHFLNNPMREAVLEKIPVYILRENPTLDGLEAMILHKQNL
jgi:glucokinase